ncbi:MAG: replicative DNA helicase [Armatimonadetes bacterium]|nr:replicative DNA helicase [Armatimonadota bacterium]
MPPDEPGDVAAERIPPQDLDAEQATLGAMLLGGDATARVAEILEPIDFYRDDHRRIYAACLTLFERNTPCDLVTVGAELRTTGDLDSVGGYAYLDRLVRATPLTTNADRYARIVHDKALLRQLLTTARVIEGSCYSTELTPAEALDQAEARILGLQRSRSTFEFEQLNPIIDRVYRDAEEKFYRGGQLSGISTGYPDLDRILAGFQDGELVVLGARPSMGKTSLAICFALNAATHRHKPTPVGVFSLEMSKEQLVAGMVCTRAGVDLQRWRNGNFRQQDWEAIAGAVNDLSKAPIFIDDTPALSPLEMRAKARRLTAEAGLGLVIVDYLQLMRGDFMNRETNRTQEISAITRALKGLAKELSVPVVACAQLARGVESRQDKRPLLSDLRESGQIEADADVVMFLYRDSYYQRENEDAPAPVDDEHTPPDPTEVIVAKQRNGPTGTVSLGFLRQYKRFVNLEQDRSG